MRLSRVHPSPGTKWKDAHSWVTNDAFLRSDVPLSAGSGMLQSTGPTISRMTGRFKDWEHSGNLGQQSNRTQEERIE
jgi:hypothetical protein